MSKKTPEIKKDNVKVIDFHKFAEREYYDYGVAVNEDRAIPCDIDGLKPVIRRLLWSAYKAGITTKTKKSARIVGDCIGRYHPHGDTAAYEALVNATQYTSPLFVGEGNFGSFTDPKFAAMRYTNAKISPLAMKVFFDPYYMPSIELIPNFDGEEKEPIILPALLPTLLLNGTAGIGVAVNSVIPGFTLKSLTTALKKLFEGEELTPKFLAKHLEFCTKYNATYDKKANKDAILSVMSDGKGRIVFDSRFNYNKTKHSLVVTGFIHNSAEALLKSLLPLHKDCILRADDLSNPKDKIGIIEISLKKNIKSPADVERALEKITSKLSGAVSFNTNITRRTKKKDGVHVTLASSSIVELISTWMHYRIELEKKMAEYWIAQADAKIHNIEILRLAISKLDLVVKALKEKHKTVDDLNQRVSSLLKITKDDAKIITDKKVYQLSSLEDSKLVENLKKIKKEKKVLQTRYKKPEVFIAEQLGNFK